jgi:hypothetical protein
MQIPLTTKKQSPVIISPKQRGPKTAQALGYKSGIEGDIAVQLKQAGLPADYEPGKLPYMDKPHTYTPDFILPNGIVIETKGYFVPEDRTKHLRIKEQYPDLDLRFVFARPENRINKTSKTTYGEWATKKGFKWSKRRIPEAWFTEPVNEASQKIIKEILITKKNHEKH